MRRARDSASCGPPSVPVDGATSVDTKTVVSVAFDEMMDCATLNAATLTLKQGAAPVPGVVDCSGPTATFTPSSALPLGAVFTATVTSVVKDLAGNALAANYVWAFTTGALPDATPPTVTFTDPADGANAVNVATTVRVAFDEAMDCATLNAATFTVLQGDVPVPGVVTCAAQAATFTPTSALDAGAAFTATVTTGVKDLAGNALGADYVWAFTTSALPDSTPPTVTFTDPADGANAVTANATIHVAFDETMDCATLNAATFTLMQGAVPVLGLVSCVGPTATFTPTNPLAPSASFTATITTGAKDSVGNALAASYVWSFSTGALPDALPPTILSTKPINGALNVAVNSVVTATFSEAMDAATITAVTFTVKQGAVAVAGSVSYAGTTATFTPAANLPVGQFTATVTTGVKDLAANAMVANVVWLFTTGASPTVLSTNPANAAHNVALDRKVDAVFSVPMNPATITAATFSLAQGAVPVVGVVSYVGSTATFTPSANYPNDTVLTATITTGAKDMNGNGLIKDYVWSFSTGAHAGPASVPLGAASSYAILAFNTVTNVNNPGTIVTGDLGISPGAALVGFPPGQVIGVTHLGDAVAAAAKGALLAAYNDAAGRLGAAVLPGDLSGLTFTPGLYKNSTSVMLSAGNFTLDAMGDANAVFIFQMGSTLTTMPGTQVILAGSAKATNIFWAVGTSATLGTTSAFKGTILAASAITMQTGASLEGRILAQAAAVSLDTNLITVPAP